jgi:hypothetical protein
VPRLFIHSILSCIDSPKQKPAAKVKRGRSVSFAGTPPEVKRRRSESRMRTDEDDLEGIEEYVSTINLYSDQLTW